MKRKCADLLVMDVNKSMFNNGLSCSAHDTTYAIKRRCTTHKSLFNLDQLPSSLFAHCCSFIAFEIKVLKLVRLNKWINQQLKSSNSCYRTDALQFTVDSRFDSAILADANQPHSGSPNARLDPESVRQWTQSQLSVPYLSRVRSISTSFRITESLKHLSAHTINQFYTGMINLKSAMLSSTLRSLQLHECDSHGSLKQGVIEWLFEQLVQTNQSIKLEELTLKIYSSDASVKLSTSASFNPINWQWRALSMMNSLQSLHLIGRSCSLPSQLIIESLPQSIVKLQVQLDQAQDGCEWQTAFSSTNFLPLLEYLDINRVDSVAVAESLAITVMSATRAVRPIRCMVFNDIGLSNVSDLGTCQWHVPIVLRLDVSLEQLKLCIVPILRSHALPVLKCFMLSVTALPNDEDVDLSQLLVLLAKRQIHNLSIHVTGQSICSLDKEAVQALTQMPLLNSLTIKDMTFRSIHSKDLFGPSVDIKQLIPSKCWPLMTTLNVSLLPPQKVTDMNVLISALPSVVSFDLSHMTSPLLSLSTIASCCTNASWIVCGTANQKFDRIPLVQLQESFERYGMVLELQHLRALIVNNSQLDSEALKWLSLRLGNRLKCT